MTSRVGEGGMTTGDKGEYDVYATDAARVPGAKLICKDTLIYPRKKN